MKIQTARGIEKAINNIKSLQIENKLRSLDINE